MLSPDAMIPQVRKIALKRITNTYQLTMSERRIAEANVERAVVDFTTQAGEILARLALDCAGAGPREETVSYPATWWQALKLALYRWLCGHRLTRWLGRRLRRRFPVKEGTMTFSAAQLFPELQVFDGPTEALIFHFAPPLEFVTPIPRRPPMTPDERARMLRLEMKTAVDCLNTDDPYLLRGKAEWVRRRMQDILTEDMRRNG